MCLVPEYAKRIALSVSFFLQEAKLNRKEAQGWHRHHQQGAGRRGRGGRSGILDHFPFPFAIVTATFIRVSSARSREKNNFVSFSFFPSRRTNSTAKRTGGSAARSTPSPPTRHRTVRRTLPTTLNVTSARKSRRSIRKTNEKVRAYEVSSMNDNLKK